MKDKEIKNIFDPLGIIIRTCRIENVGFTNKVYVINEKYVLKVCIHLENETAFRKSAWLYKYFQDTLPVPKVLLYDDSKKISSFNYLICEFLPGKNLYHVWHEYDTKLRRNVMKQLCNILRRINEAPLEDVHSLFTKENWYDKLCRIIDEHCDKLSGVLDEVLLKRIRQFVKSSASCLDEQCNALTYFDAHFDNILVEDGIITGFLDFERTDIRSIDYVLDVIKRMRDEPFNYSSEESFAFIVAEDYDYLLDWMKEFYPELFSFKNMDLRFDVYAIEHDLGSMINFPENHKLLQERIEKCLERRNY